MAKWVGGIKHFLTQDDAILHFFKMFPSIRVKFNDKNEFKHECKLGDFNVTVMIYFEPISERWVVHDW